MARKIRPKEQAAILQALQAGVVPKNGLQHIQVGRKPELNALIKDIERIADGGSAFRLIVGEYGAGKTFFMHVVKHIALKQKLVTVNADLSPERRLVASGGQSRMLYSELISNLSTMSSPEGNALGNILDVFTHSIVKESKDTDTPAAELIEQKLLCLNSYVGGYDMSKVMIAYCKGYQEGDDHLRNSALRWLRGEYTTKTEARQDLGVRTFIDDNMVYDALKLIARFVEIAGFKGMLVILDEGVNLFKIHNTASRKSNYEMVLRILNDTLQGDAEHFGILMGVTQETVFDAKRGFCSYAALSSRLTQNQFAAQSGLVDYNQPTISLVNLTPEELYVLLGNVRNVFAGGGDEDTWLIDNAGIQAFMKHCHEKMGAAYFQTPRESVRSFVNLLSMLDQYPDKRWSDFIESLELRNDIDPNVEKELAKTGAQELQEFSL